MNDYNINGLGIPLFVFFMLVEYLYLKLRGRDLHRVNDTVTSLSMGMCLLISDALLKTFTFGAFIYCWHNFRLFEFSSSSALTWLLFFFAVDICYYWFHRCAHEINLLWGAHVGHHQSEEYNLTTALRQSAFQYAFSWVFYLPLAFLGCPPVVFLGLFALLKMYQFWLHTQAIDRIPLLEGIFSTPSSHRVHHAKNPCYIDRNYGGTLVIWDRLFGSWQPERNEEPCHYGTTKPLNTLNPISANLQHWSQLMRDSWQTKSWKDKGLLWLKPTGWRPDDCRHTEDTMQQDGCADRQKYNPQANGTALGYAALSTILTLIAATLFITVSPQQSAMQLLYGTLLIVGGMVIASQILENNHRWVWLEVIRLPLLAGFVISLHSFF